MRWILVAVCMMIVGCGNSPTGPYEVEQATPNTHGVFVQNDDDSHPVVLPLTAERDSTWTERNQTHPCLLYTSPSPRD